MKRESPKETNMYRLTLTKALCLTVACATLISPLTAVAQVPEASVAPPAPTQVSV